VIDWPQIVTTIVVALIGATPPTIAILLSNKKTQEKVDGMTHTLVQAKVAEATSEATLAEKRAEHVRKGEAAVVTASTQRSATKRDRADDIR
jgi:mannose/fructose-specific phosphotransferase system component IIA